jgi:hypothetical protein
VVAGWPARPRNRRGLWAAINIACGAAILIGAALMGAVVKM